MSSSRPTGRGRKFLELMKRLTSQSVKADRIIIMNTEEKYFDGLLYGTDFAREYPEAEVHHLSKREYDHGGTRDIAASKSSADLFLCMTDDAVPADDRLIERLRDAAVPGRGHRRGLCQTASGQRERGDRAVYQSLQLSGGELHQGTAAAENAWGSKPISAPTSAPCTGGDVFRKLGGFEKHTIFNEDMIYAARAVKAGWRIAYAADARVYHSHNYTAKEQFHRNFDNGVSQAQHPEIFAGVSSEAEGVKLVKKTSCPSVPESGSPGWCRG